MASSDWDEDLAAWHAGWDTPAEIIDSVVRRATRAGVARDDKIIEGHGNEIHGVVTDTGRELIVRIARRPGPVFEHECWPLDAARRAGIPVPEVLSIEHTEMDGQPVSFQVQTRLPGQSLYRLAPHLSDTDFARLVREAGQVLGRIHEIDVPGPGPIKPDGTLAPGSAAGPALMAGVSERSAYLVEHGIDRSLVDQIVERIASPAAVVDDTPVGLVHGDWRITNVLTDGVSITGVVDWEGGGGGDPARDLAISWNLWPARGRTASASMRTGYRETRSTLDAGLDERRMLYELVDRHHACVHFIATGRPDLLDKTLHELRTLLREANNPC